jgi:protein AATF/BFR2
MADEARVIEKSRQLLSESRRVDKNDGTVRNDGNDDEGIQSSRKRGRDTDSYDLEVYDDRQFYSMLLKTFISSATAADSGMGKEEILAVQRYKSRNQRVDRKASKGRKIRYVVHPKLQNFMFPIRSTEKTSEIDTRILVDSLFQ